MAYTFPWDEAFPPGTQSADQINEDLQRILVQTRERLADILGVVFPNDTVTTATASKLVLKGSATSKIIPGATSHSIRNNADSADNLLVNDTGDLIIRNSLVTKGNIGGRFLSIDDTSDVAQFQITISGGGGLQFKPIATATLKHLFLLDSTNVTKVDIDFQSGASTWSGLLTINAGGLIVGGGGAGITGNSFIAGTLLINGGAGTALTELRGATSSKRSLFYTTGGSVRWEAYANATVESGSNAGSDWQLSNYNDAGTFIGNPISIFRSNGSIWFESSVQSRFRFSGISNGAMVSTLDFYSSPVGTPTVYSRAGGIELQYTAGAISGFGIFADSVNLEIKSTDTSKTVTILNALSISTTGVASATPMLILNKDNGASTAIYGQLLRQGVAKAYFGLDSADNFCFYDTSAANKIIQLGNNGVVTIGTQTGYPSANFTDGANTLEMGWTGNTFFFKQTQVTDRSLVFRNHSNQDVMTVGYSSGEITAGVGVFNTAVGYRINSLAPSGQYLRGNGTNAVFNTIQAGDLPTTLTPTILTIGGGQNISRVLSNSLTWNPGTITSNSQNATTVTVTGAQVGDTVWISNIWLADNIFAILQAWVSALNTVTVQITNHSAGSITLTNRTVKVWVVG